MGHGPWGMAQVAVEATGNMMDASVMLATSTGVGLLLLLIHATTVMLSSIGRASFLHLNHGSTCFHLLVSPSSSTILHDSSWYVQVNAKTLIE